MIKSFLRDKLVPGYLHWSGKRHLLPLFNSLIHAGRPAAIAFPAELLDQGLAIFLSGLNNTLAVQGNPGWVWPHWVERQIDPESDSFLPTATNIIKSNLTHRNWTSLGVEGSSREAMVDPVGMLTLQPYGASVFPYLRLNGSLFLPPRMHGSVVQELAEKTLPVVVTRYAADASLSWTSEAMAVHHESGELLLFTHRLRNESRQPIQVSFGLTLRPYNPLMFAPINHLAYEDERFRVNGEWSFYLSEPPARVSLSNRRLGDPLAAPADSIRHEPLISRSGILAAAAEYDWNLPPKGERVLYSVGILSRSRDHIATVPATPAAISRLRVWELERLRAAETSGLQIRIPDTRLEEAFRAVKNRLHVFDDGSHFSPGTFLYHGHWFRDSAFIALAFDQMGFGKSVGSKIGNFLRRQDRDGFFRSQNGEWDSNGQAIWTIVTHVQRGGDPAVLERAYPALLRGGRWIDRMRRKSRTEPSLHFGLLPAGFSAEHFGPNDHYYWDNLWSLAGLEKLAWAARRLGRQNDAHEIGEILAEFRGDVESSMMESFARADYQGLPSSPYRGLDSATIGNLVGLSPLGVTDPKAGWIGGTVEFLARNNLRDGLFLQKIIHTGLNAYLSAQLARVLTRRFDPRGFEILEALIRHGGPTLSWPEAIHPRTHGGCMGDGDHGWAAAEFLNLIRDLMVREEGGQLLLLSGAPESWFHAGATLGVAAAPTLHGEVSFQAEVREQGLAVTWNVRRLPHQDPGEMALCLPESYARLLGISGRVEGPHLRVVLPESSGSAFYKSPLFPDAPEFIPTSLHERSSHV